MKATIKTSLSILLLFLASINVQAQKDSTSNWTIGVFTSLQLNQSSFVNWVAGGENSFATTALGNFSAVYKKDKISWENRIDLAYGVQWTKSLGLRKNEDKIDLLSKFGYQMKDHLFFAALANFKSQFDRGFNFPDDSTVISQFMAPGYLLVSAGFDYKPVDYFSLYISPATGKFTFVTRQSLADQGAFGVEAAETDTLGKILTPGKNVNAEFGAYLTARFEKEVIKNTTLISRLDLFNNYTDSDKDNRKQVDVNWENTLNFKVNKFITASLFLHLIYDNDIKFLNEDTGAMESRVQFKQVLGIGFAYKLE